MVIKCPICSNLLTAWDASGADKWWPLIIGCPHCRFEAFLETFRGKTRYDRTEAYQRFKQFLSDPTISWTLREAVDQTNSISHELDRLEQIIKLEER
jgi:hypothetical protein